MSSRDAFKGVMKWFERKEWQAPFADLVRRHLGAACERTGMAPDALAGLIGEPYGSILWACLVEDFLACQIDDGRNILDDYLRKRSRSESVASKRYLEALRQSTMSLYEVNEIVPASRCSRATCCAAAHRCASARRPARTA